jgi:hypothetical protein
MPATSAPSARLTVSDIRQRIFEVSDEPSRGIGNVWGQLFHRVADCALQKEHPASWHFTLTDELDAEAWMLKLYDEVLGPGLTNLQSSLHDNGSEVWLLWCSVHSFTKWFCGLLTEAMERGHLKYDAASERWIGADTLFEI